MQKLKQLTFEEALDHLRRKEKVYATTFQKGTPVLKRLETMNIGTVVGNEEKYVFQIVEEE